MVGDLRSAFIEGFNSLGWMDEKTRAAAKGKAEAINEKVGYPKFIMDSKELDKYYEGVRKISILIKDFGFLLNFQN